MNSESKNLFSDFEQAFYKDGYALAKEFMKNDIDSNSVLKLTRSVYSTIDEFIKLFITQCYNQNKKIDCKKGCSICCYQCILVSPHELFYLYNFLTNELNSEDLTEVKNKAKVKHDLTKLMKAKEFIHFKHPCPLLKDNICIVYEARPIACRIYLSSEVKSCEDEYYSPKNINVFPALFELPLRIGRRFNEGINQVFKETSFSLAEIKLEEAILIMFEKKEIFDNWLTKKNIFKKYELDEIDTNYINKFSR